MNLTALAIRICAVEAIAGATIAEERVFDSRFEEMDSVAASTKLPVISVYTDDDRLTAEGGTSLARAVLVGKRELKLAVDMGVASIITIPLPNGETVEEVGFPETDSNHEALLNVMGHQVFAALFAGSGPWADLFRSFVTNVSSIDSVRGADVKNGTRFAARSIVFTLDTISDPPFGVAIPAGTPWAIFLAKAKDTPRFAKIAALIEAETSGTVPAWAAVKAMMGWTSEEAEAAGITPFNADDPATSFTVVGSDGSTELIVSEDPVDGDG